VENQNKRYVIFALLLGVLIMFTLFKKKKSKSGYLAGDLAPKQTETEPEEPAQISKINSTPDCNRAGVVVFLEYKAGNTKGWICEKCGVENDDIRNQCVVCGFRK
jgi:hypothetical protein